MRRPRLAYVVTHPVSADLLLRGQLAFMREAGFDVTVIASPGVELERVAQRERVATRAVAMAREPSPARDAVALARLTATIHRLRPDIVNASTPKAGLLGMLAARAARVPVRLYLLRGLRLETTKGRRRAVLSATERIASSCAHHVPCVSASLMRAAVDGGWVPAEKALVVGPGSSHGVDVAAFAPTAAMVAEGRRRLSALGVADDAIVIGFVARLAADKGAAELLDAFDLVRRAEPRSRLLLVGSDLGDEKLDAALVRRAAQTPGVVLTGTTSELAPLYATMRVLAFPSHREGFPNVPLEAAAAGVPTVGFRATGTIDAVVDGVTGSLVDKHDVAGLARSLLAYVSDGGLAAQRGGAARERAAAEFDEERIARAWVDFYVGCLTAHGLPRP